MAIKPANRYNIDKTGILKGKGSNGLVLGRAKTKSVRKKRLDHKPKQKELYFLLLESTPSWAKGLEH
ncbi:transposase [Colletotrichum incanum]|nr:transposase [Colletotrichum incanum]